MKICIFIDNRFIFFLSKNENKIKNCLFLPKVWFQNRRSKERRMKQLNAMGSRRQVYRNAAAAARIQQQQQQQQSNNDTNQTSNGLRAATTPGAAAAAAVSTTQTTTTTPTAAQQTVIPNHLSSTNSSSSFDLVESNELLLNANNVVVANQNPYIQHTGNYLLFILKSIFLSFFLFFLLVRNKIRRKKAK